MRTLKFSTLVTILSILIVGLLVGCGEQITNPNQTNSQRNNANAQNHPEGWSTITVDPTCLLDGYYMDIHVADGVITWYGNQMFPEYLNARGHHCVEVVGDHYECIHCGWITGLPPQVPGEPIHVHCDCEEGEFFTENPVVVNLGFIGHYLFGDRVLNTSFYWQELLPGEMIDWDAVEAAYADWVGRGGLAPDYTNGWKSSGFAPLFFANGAAIGHDDFTPAQLESLYLEYYLATGYVLPHICVEVCEGCDVCVECGECECEGDFSGGVECPAILVIKGKDLEIRGLSVLAQSNGQRWYTITVERPNGTVKVLNYNNESGSSKDVLTIKDKGLENGVYTVVLHGQNVPQTVTFEIVNYNGKNITVNNIIHPSI